MVLSEGGAPLSAGQKQLAALARALLKRSKVRQVERPPPFPISPAYPGCLCASADALMRATALRTCTSQPQLFGVPCLWLLPSLCRVRRARAQWCPEGRHMGC